MNIRSRFADIRLILQVFGFIFLLKVQLQQPFELVYLLLIPIWAIGWLMIASAAHCHIHYATFKSAGLNRSWELFLTLVRGTSISLMRIHHINNHHAHCNNPKDWMNTTSLNTPRSLLRNWVYVIYGFKKSIAGLKELKKSARLNEALRAQIKTEQWVTRASFAMAFILNPEVFMGVLLPAWLMGIGLLILSNLWNHDAQEDPLDQSTVRDFTSPLLNFVLFNGGYHWVHHLKPNAHWTEYPQLQQEVDNWVSRKKVPWKRYEEKSFLLFFYIFYWKQKAS